MRKKFSYTCDYSESLIKIFDTKKIKYTIIGDGVYIKRFMRFSLFADDPFVQILPNYGVYSHPMIENIYTKNELLSSEYLTIHPKKQVVDIKNIDDATETSCDYKNAFGIEKTNHVSQKSSFEIYSLKKNDKTCFYFESSGISYLFAKISMIQVFEQNHISGILPYPVYLSKEKNIQAEVTQLMSTEMIFLTSIFIDKEDRLKKCQFCGRTKIVDVSGYQLKLDTSKLLLNDDFYMTEAVFGEGIPHPIYLVSQKLYRLIMEEHFNKNVRFEPVILKK